MTGTDLNGQLARVTADIRAQKMLVQQHYRTRNLEAMRDATQQVAQMEFRRRQIKLLIAWKPETDAR